ncbi:MAG TPA: peptide chain release factor N(5)-glutamine methyltransferase [Candidatus Eisenbergiella merdipullorum]|uniref:Release factor glutamine methyltransferase n=1 Tax=Candidatus Eisenbergiella merdipullorum TaxID=2838553 RepID=A0A9D2I6E4_9FIRM|nr:peptide chain release factor N(5)-glutamine methyltransferase [Candidatus Eisenbergiella merdipullorum]
MTYAEIYRSGREALEAAGIGEAELDARLLLEAVCHTSRNDLLVHGDREITEEQEKQYQGWIALRASHIPLQHITGVQEFMGLEFLVNEDVLIPRQDTEILVEEVLRELTDGSSILDLCTGSGCILLSLLRFSNDCVGVGSDISEKALTIARKNADRLGLHAKFLCGDLFERVEGKYDFIVSNPPYIASGEIDGLMEEVRLHEPLSALDGHEDGLFFYRRIIKECGDYLKRGGSLYLEIGWDQGNAVKAMMEGAGFHEVRVTKDYAELDRVVSGVWF